ncbi:hypothetical protein NPIL_7091 [Nephila pilipes]|uniref:Uncharacterized protein n=1 Tax=Nephila pilipes TaxID=299642 RepID=A0A8X6U9W5_NEPPI|nr:hypothetical protein NPIL_253971 [Nephila pilipes]GFU07817.1 hypothetical protein NPIL_7091 [Nephila pilipes]
MQNSPTPQKLRHKHSSRDIGHMPCKLNNWSYYDADTGDGTFFFEFTHNSTEDFGAHLNFKCGISHYFPNPFLIDITEYKGAETTLSYCDFPF